MVQNRSGHRPGGGIASKQHVSIPVRTGTGSRAARPGGVGQLGNIQGSHVTSHDDSDYRGEPLHGGRSFQPVKFGNELALNSGTKPGQGRDIHPAGGQGQHGSVAGNPRPAGRGILDNS